MSRVGQIPSLRYRKDSGLAEQSCGLCPCVISRGPVGYFNEKNPQPDTISVHLGPRAGKAAFSTRIRLADSQNVVAIAELSDHSLWSDTVEVIVTIAACLEYN